MSKIEFEVIAGGCGSGPCPTVYKTKDGRYFVQGYIVNKETSANFNLPNNEMLVEVDEALVQNIIDEPK
jgi:hypothetical protein